MCRQGVRPDEATEVAIQTLTAMQIERGESDSRRFTVDRQMGTQD